MKYTFEISIAGCSTDCAHCYVDGGPAPQMGLRDYEYCIDTLKPVLDRIEGDISLTLGNEMFCHSGIDELLSFTAHSVPGYFSFADSLVPTTGIALLARKDRGRIIETLKAAGARGFMLAVHGGEQAHNETVRRKGAYSALFEAAEYFADNGLDILFNLIVSKTLCADFEQVMGRIGNYPKADIALTVPLYVPTERMRRYQSRRAEYDDCLVLAGKAEKYAADTSGLLKHCREHNEKAVIAKLRDEGFSYEQEKRNVIQWKFFNITQNGDIFYGNVGAHTRYIGNIFNIADDKLLEEIVRSDPNYDYIAYYPEEAFYFLEKNTAHLPVGNHNYVYKSKEECIYALLDGMGVKNALI